MAPQHHDFAFTTQLSGHSKIMRHGCVRSSPIINRMNDKLDNTIYTTLEPKKLYTKLQVAKADCRISIFQLSLFTNKLTCSHLVFCSMLANY